jgi:hypothetical protein
MRTRAASRPRPWCLTSTQSPTYAARAPTQTSSPIATRRSRTSARRMARALSSPAAACRTFCPRPTPTAAAAASALAWAAACMTTAVSHTCPCACHSRGTTPCLTSRPRKTSRTRGLCVAPWAQHAPQPAAGLALSQFRRLLRDTELCEMFFMQGYLGRRAKI